MPFPVEEKYITETELEFDVKFPIEFKKSMIVNNGGEFYEFQLYPFFDKSSKKRISRTCNHIGLETKRIREWDNFPTNAIAIGSDGSGNCIVLMHNGNKILSDEIFFWDHETGECEKIAENINDIEESRFVHKNAKKL